MNEVKEFEHKLPSQFLLLLMHDRDGDFAWLNIDGMWGRDILYTLTRACSLHSLCHFHSEYYVFVSHLGLAHVRETLSCCGYFH